MDRLRSPLSTLPDGIRSRLFPQRSPPWLLTTAACGGLRSAPDCRTRRVLLHLSYSCASPFGPALLVTQDPLRNKPPPFLSLPGRGTVIPAICWGPRPAIILYDQRASAPNGTLRPPVIDAVRRQSAELVDSLSIHLDLSYCGPIGRRARHNDPHVPAWGSR